MTTTLTSERTLRLSLPVPPSVNHAWRTGKYGQTYRVRACQQFAALVRLAAIEAGWPCGYRLAPPISVSVWLTKPATWKKRLDLDNVRKVLYDALALTFGFDDDEIGEDHGYKGKGAIPKPALVVEIKGRLAPAR